MVGFCFIVLHYQGYDDTVECVNSIEKLDLYDESKIIIIDNASPNKSGERLYNKYRYDNHIDVLLNESNAGFSKANNKACEYAAKKYNPQFYIVMNNDIIIEDIDFLNKIRAEYDKSGFFVLGPDIYNPNQRIHQSPLCDKVPGNILLTKTIVLNKLLLMLLPFSGKFIIRYFRKLNAEAKDSNKYSERQINKCLMGACLIFSRKFYKEKKILFYPETDFYYEEYILHLYCTQESKLTVYNPQIKIIHNSGAATQKSYSRELERDIFVIKNTVEAAKICKDYSKRLKRKRRIGGR